MSLVDVEFVDVVGLVGVGCMADGREEESVGSGGGRGEEGVKGTGGWRCWGMVVVRGREMVGINCGRSRLIYAQTCGFT